MPAGVAGKLPGLSVCRAGVPLRAGAWGQRAAGLLGVGLRHEQGGEWETRFL